MAAYTVDELLRYLRGRGSFDADVRIDAIELLAEMGDPRIRSALETVMADADEVDDVREAAAGALGRRALPPVD